MKNLLLLLFLSILSSATMAQTAAEYVKKGDDAVNSRKESLALDYYKKAIAKDNKSSDAYAGASLMYSRIGNRQSVKDTKIKYFKAAKIHALRAVKLNSTSSFAHYTVAVAMGRMALISGSKEKVAASRDIKKYADKAIQLDSKNSEAWNVLGKWNFAVSNLNFAEKAAAKMIFGGLPDGDINQAIKCFEKTRALNPTMVRNYLDLAKAYKQAGKNTVAKAMLQKGIRLGNKTYDDASSKKEMNALLATF